MGEKLSLEEAAAEIGRSVATMGRWIRERRIAVVRLLGRTYVTRAEVDRVKTSEAVPARAPAPDAVASGKPRIAKKARR